nr:hypothetical protein [uncultured Oscillibacter sp.]
MSEKKKRDKPAKLDVWQKRLADSNSAYSAQVAKMDDRERLYCGDHTLAPLVQGDTRRDGQPKKTSHVRNIIFENIESQVSSSIPQPKVTPRRKEDEHLADVIEHFLRNELDRLPFETMNDMAERTVPVQGGVGFFVEWDNARRTHDTVGEIGVSVIHPKQFAPQPGVYTGIEDMDWFILKIPTTKETVKRKYGVNVRDESEAEPDVRGVDGTDTTEDAITQYVGFARNDQGGIDRYSWVNDIELEDLENYQARRQPVCKKCGRVRPLPGQIIHNAVQDTLSPGNLLPDPARGFAGGLIPRELGEREIAGRALADQLAQGAAQPVETPGGGEPVGVLAGVNVAAEQPPAEPVHYDGGPCPWCGCKDFTSAEQEFEQVMLPIRTPAGTEIPGAEPGLDDMGQPVLRPTMIPFYKPDLFPIILQRSVSVYGQLLGNSDVDVIRDQQNTINRMEQKIIDRLVKAGTRITLPDKANLRTDPEDGERWYIGNAADKAMIGLYDFKGDLEYELLYLANVYEEARQILGITDSFQGRQDTTATSGKAKEFSAAQAAGRLESKRVMKDAAYAAIFELMFKFALAYSDEPRPVTYKDFKGEARYEEFNRYDFLKRDADGAWYWNDQFLFSCDTSAPLASNREAMWQETRMNLQTGAFGDPSSTETLILFWAKMEELHYPGAGTTKAFLEDKLQREQQMARMQQMQMAAMQAQQQPEAQGTGGQLPQGMVQAIDERARQDAMAAAGGNQTGTGM